MSTKAYKQAIETLMSRDVEIDYRSIVVKLAQHSPTLFNKLYAEIAAPVLVGDPKPGMSDAEREAEREADRRGINILDSLRYRNAKVDAIKLIRDTYGFGLKESKDVADHLCNYLSKAGYCVAEYHDPAWLNSSQQRVLDKLIWIDKHPVR